MCQPYSSGVDVWSVGCVFFECLLCLLGELPTSGYTNAAFASVEPRRPRALFKGRSSYPLSPQRPGMQWDESHDQLHAIFRVIGTPHQEEVESVLIAVPSNDDSSGSGAAGGGGNGGRPLVTASPNSGEWIRQKTAELAWKRQTAVASHLRTLKPMPPADISELLPSKGDVSLSLFIN